MRFRSHRNVAFCQDWLRTVFDRSRPQHLAEHVSPRAVLAAATTNGGGGGSSTTSSSSASSTSDSSGSWHEAVAELPLHIQRLLGFHMPGQVLNKVYAAPGPPDILQGLGALVGTFAANATCVFLDTFLVDRTPTRGASS
jgi:hypothetical protein